MTEARVVQIQPSDWPPRPEGEVFPEVLRSVEVAMLLRYDSVPNMTPDKAARNVRNLVRNCRLPTLGRVGKSLLFSKADVLTWLAGRGGGPKEPPEVDSKGETEEIATEQQGELDEIALAMLRPNP